MPEHRMERIGITTTIPSEVIFAAGAVPVDLNNIFITSPRRAEYIRAAERAGYPRNVCGWIKGMYGVLAECDDIRTVVAVTQGDCSNTHALMETLELIGIRTIPFAYPYDRDPSLMQREIDRLAEVFGVDMSAAEEQRLAMEPVRELLARLDDMTWRDNLVTGGENHLRLVSSSDFNGSPDEFGRELGEFLADASGREPLGGSIRLGYMGVPPIIDDIYDVVGEYGGRVVFNEVQRQFSMPGMHHDLAEQYLAYTYPYSIFQRLEDISAEIAHRRIDGMIHYVQSFCHRHIEDLVVRPPARCAGADHRRRESRLDGCAHTAQGAGIYRDAVGAGGMMACTDETILGLDLGSRNVKYCLMRSGAVAATGSIEAMTFYREYGIRSEAGFGINIGALGFDNVGRVAATGYGRNAAAIMGAENISELTAHFRGARRQTGLDDFTLLDMGGQDYKVMRIARGRIADMATNDKCAASTGRYLENMAAALGITLDELGKYADNPLVMSSTCAIFGESELIGMVVRGEPVARIAAGVNRAVVERVLPHIERMGSGVIVMAGGVALNRAVVRLLGEATGAEVCVVENPLHNGAIGCCVK